MKSVYIQTLKHRIAEAENRFQAAKNRGEREDYLAVAKFDIDQMKADLERGEVRKAS